MSGGVDSSVAALLLQREGHDVVGLFLRNGVSRPAGAAPSNRQGCCSIEDSRDAAAVAHVLGIPFYVLDHASEFGAVIDDFVAAYRSGRTPNPCVLCNRDLKFGSLLEFARGLGADTVATGHYARIDASRAEPRLRRAADAAKDQSYVLAALAPESLRAARFPLGDLTKSEVRALAREAGLPVSEKRESQEICFVPTNDYRDLLRARGVHGTPGPIRDGAGREIGRHGGFEGFTVGQRRGLGIPAAEPLFVTDIDPATATITVGPRTALACEGFVASGVRWFSASGHEARKGAEPIGPIAREYRVQLRAHQTPAACGVCVEGTTIRVTFATPQPAVAPGQLAVLYEGDLVAGSAWIDSTL